MNQKYPFGKSATILLVAVIAIVAFVRGNMQLWLLIGAFGIYGFVIAVHFLRKNKTQRIPKKWRHLAESIKPVTAKQMLIRHINNRITTYVKSVFPEATWEWACDNVEQLVLEGGSGRISLFGAPNFNYVDITFDQMARIDCEMLNVVPLSALTGNGQPTTAAASTSAQSIDAESWFTVQGKEVLANCIADLNSRGHSKLYIKESGEICVSQSGAETVADTLKDFPGRDCWQNVVKVFENAGISAAITENAISVSW